MTWSFRFVRIFGIDIKIHLTFFLILLLGAFQWGLPHGWKGAWFGIILMGLLFACVTLHELGHSLAARVFGISTREIVLLPIGGVALLERMPRNPMHELVIALAGPLVNVAIAGVLALVGGLSLLAGGLDMSALWAGRMIPSWETLLLWLLGSNLFLVFFNMIPAFPLDGGRVFRALLGFFTDHTRATNIAAMTGQTLAVGGGLFGILSANFMLGLVALFVFFAAGQEKHHVRTASLLSQISVGRVFNRHAQTLAPGDPLARAVDLVLTSYQPEFAVLRGSALAGVLTRERLLRALAGGLLDSPVGEVMQPSILAVQARASLEEVRDDLLNRGERVAAVFDGPRYLGLVSLEDMAEALLVLPHVTRWVDPSIVLSPTRSLAS